jgi:hypothetical protein
MVLCHLFLFFSCDVKLCLSTTLVCDGHQHCEDGSDEAPTFCTQKEQVFHYIQLDKYNSEPSDSVLKWIAFFKNYL